MKQEYTRQELSDLREQELNEWCENKWNEVFGENGSEMTPSQIYDIETKGLTSFKMHKDKIELVNDKGITTFLYLTNPTNSFIAQMIYNLHKDKELK